MTMLYILIRSKDVPERVDSWKWGVLHRQYQNQIDCDWQLLCKDGPLYVHSTPFLTYGGNKIKNLFESAEDHFGEKLVSFLCFSSSTVKIFVDFMYLGEKALSPEIVKKDKIDLFELFKLAHSYEVQSLMDCCTNLISLLAISEDQEKIKSYADQYRNDHLHELHKYLVQTTNPLLRV